MASKSQEDQIRKEAAVAMANLRSQLSIQAAQIHAKIDTVKDALLKDLILVDADGNPIRGPDGQLMVAPSKIAEFLQFQQGMAQLQMGIAVLKDDRGTSLDETMKDSLAVLGTKGSTVSEMQLATNNIGEASMASMTAMGDAMRIFNQAAFGGPLTCLNRKQLPLHIPLVRRLRDVEPFVALQAD